MFTHLLVIAAVTVVGLLLLRLFRRDRPQPTSVEPWVIEAFEKKKRQQWLLGIPIGLVLLLFSWQKVHPSGIGIFVSLFAVVIVAGVCLFTYRNWRCPKCGAYLGKYAWQAGVCPNCGTALRVPRKN